jgi:hypothetical protein
VADDEKTICKNGHTYTCSQEKDYQQCEEKRQTELHLQIYTSGLQLSIHKLHAGHIITIIVFITRQLQFSDEEEETWRAL